MGDGDEHGRIAGVECRSVLRGRRNLQRQVSCEGSPRFSGRIRVMQRPKSTKTWSSIAAAVAAELEQYGSSERKRTTEGGEWKDLRVGLFIRASS